MIAITHSPSPDLQRCQLTHQPARTIDFGLALSQHAAYLRMLEELRVRVITLEVNRDMPDSVFVEDTAVVLDELAVMTPMGTTSRRGEPPGIERELLKHREIRRIGLPATLEGGDVLGIGKRLLVGLSTRTNREGIRELGKIISPFGYELLPVPIRGCLHLKTACTALPDGRLLVNPRWLDMEALGGFECIPVPEDEPFAANLLPVGDTVCLAAAHPQTMELVVKAGFKVRTADISEFAKAEGAMTCMSLIFSAG